jgi:hypothetical protein
MFRVCYQGIRAEKGGPSVTKGFMGTKLLESTDDGFSLIRIDYYAC